MEDQVKALAQELAAEKSRGDQWQKMAENLNTNLSVAQDRILELEAALAEK
jgi:hypothetical protein